MSFLIKKKIVVMFIASGKRIFREIPGKCLCFYKK